ncbi:Uncharacterised protein [Yersinia frederiksenii]|nr:Uncharacterised protein [Yersinia frederiksenii]
MVFYIKIQRVISGYWYRSRVFSHHFTAELWRFYEKSYASSRVNDVIFFYF